LTVTSSFLLFLWGGNPRRVLNAARSRTIDIFASPALIAELSKVLVRERFERRLESVQSSAAKIIDEYQALATTVNVQHIGPTISRDPDDDEVVACAIAADCDFIVSGDRDLLDLKEYRGIEILTASKFLVELELNYEDK
jgi:putative PIN family toxin of toxin-antitoxin system